MKILICYNDSPFKAFHKTMRLTIPTAWYEERTVRDLLVQFVKSYNAVYTMKLDSSELHLAKRIQQVEHECGALEDAGGTSDLATATSIGVMSYHYEQLPMDAPISSLIGNITKIFARHNTAFVQPKGNDGKVKLVLIEEEETGYYGNEIQSSPSDRVVPMTRNQIMTMSNQTWARKEQKSIMKHGTLLITTDQNSIDSTTDTSTFNEEPLTLLTTTKIENTEREQSEFVSSPETTLNITPSYPITVLDDVTKSIRRSKYQKSSYPNVGAKFFGKMKRLIQIQSNFAPSRSNSPATCAADNGIVSVNKKMISLRKREKTDYSDDDNNSCSTNGSVEILRLTNNRNPSSGASIEAAHTTDTNSKDRRSEGQFTTNTLTDSKQESENQVKSDNGNNNIHKDEVIDTIRKEVLYHKIDSTIQLRNSLDELIEDYSWLKSIATDSAVFDLHENDNTNKNEHPNHIMSHNDNNNTHVLHSSLSQISENKTNIIMETIEDTSGEDDDIVVDVFSSSTRDGPPTNDDSDKVKNGTIHNMFMNAWNETKNFSTSTTNICCSSPAVSFEPCLNRTTASCASVSCSTVSTQQAKDDIVENAQQAYQWISERIDEQKPTIERHTKTFIENKLFVENEMKEFMERARIAFRTNVEGFRHKQRQQSKQQQQQQFYFEEHEEHGVSYDNGANAVSISVE